MCGIAGFISSKPLSVSMAQDLSRALLYYSEERGPQSAGLWSAENGLLKRAINAHEFIEGKDFLGYWKNPSKACLIHTRQPTCGDRSDAQAQPFTSNGIAVVHNGWYHNAKALKAKWNLSKSSGVDSELAKDFIETYGIEMLPEFIDSSHGSSAIGALVDNKMFLYRDSNPIVMVSIKTYDGIKVSIFASTREILESAIKYVWLVPDLQYIELKEHRVYQLLPGGLQGTGVKHKRKRGFTDRLKDWDYKAALSEGLTDLCPDDPDDAAVIDFFRHMKPEMNS